MFCLYECVLVEVRANTYLVRCDYLEILKPALLQTFNNTITIHKVEHNKGYNNN